MKVAEIRKKSDDELKQMLEQERRSVSNLRFRMAASQLDDPSQVEKSRRTIARIQTILKERTKNG